MIKNHWDEYLGLITKLIPLSHGITRFNNKKVKDYDESRSEEKHASSKIHYVDIPQYKNTICSVIRNQ